MKSKNATMRVPGAMQREAERSAALQTRDPGFFRVTSNRDPGSAVHRSADTARCTASGTRLIPRRSFFALLGGAAAATAWLPSAHAQQAGPVKRVGIFSGFPNDAEGQNRVKAFTDKLAVLGWVDGRNVKLESIWAPTDAERARILAAGMVATAPDVILAMTVPALVALRQETRTIPIIFVQVSDPVDGGFVQSMARPGGNITGFTSFEYSVGGKWLELLKEAAPSLTRVLVLLNQDNYASRALLRVIESVSPMAKVRVSSAGVRNAAEIEAALAAFGKEPKGGVIVLPDPVTTTHRELIAALAVKHRLPTIYTFRFFVTGGGLMSYGTDISDLYRQAATYVDRVLKGAKPADLPVQNPVKYLLTVNLKTAKAIGLTIPEIFLVRADEVIE
jgi:putative ABC transport system substrate-binding protein